MFSGNVSIEKHFWGALALACFYFFTLSVSSKISHCLNLRWARVICSQSLNPCLWWDAQWEQMPGADAVDTLLFGAIRYHSSHLKVQFEAFKNYFADFTTLIAFQQILSLNLVFYSCSKGGQFLSIKMIFTNFFFKMKYWWSLVLSTWQFFLKQMANWQYNLEMSMSLIFGEGNGNPLLCSCLENPMGRGA